jgi:hypothetical protein
MLTTRLKSLWKRWQQWREDRRWVARERAVHYQGRVCDEWDAELIALSYVFRFEYDTLPSGRVLKSPHVVALGPHRLWVSNFPYACFYVHDRLQDLPARRLCKMPHLKTAYMLRDKLAKELPECFASDS